MAVIALWDSRCGDKTVARPSCRCSGGSYGGTAAKYRGYLAVRLVWQRSVPTTRTSLLNTKNQRKCCPQILGSTSVACVAASGVLVAASGVVCNSFLFSFEIACNTKLLTSDGARTKTRVSLINHVALVGQKHEAFGLQGRVVDVAHASQAHPCHNTYPEPVVFQWQSNGNPVCLELRPQCTLECHWRKNCL